MARCTAPVNAHRTASGAASCQACSSRYGYRSNYSFPTYNDSYNPIRNSSSGNYNSSSFSRTSPILFPLAVIL